MSGEIEFLDPGPEPAPARGPAGRRRALAVAVAGWLAAAALAVIAPFQALFGVLGTTRHADYLAPRLLPVDGWGGSAGAPRFGIGLAVCAAVLAATALVALAQARRLVGRHRATLAAAVAGPCLLGGLVAGIALYVGAHPVVAGTGWTAYPSGLTLAGVSSYTSALTVRVDHPSLTPWCLWLSVAALACALAGSAGYLAFQAPTPRLAG